jgi:hypothetical protein
LDNKRLTFSETYSSERAERIPLTRDDVLNKRRIILVERITKFEVTVLGRSTLILFYVNHLGDNLLSPSEPIV